MTVRHTQEGRVVPEAPFVVVVVKSAAAAKSYKKTKDIYIIFRLHAHHKRPTITDTHLHTHTHDAHRAQTNTRGGWCRVPPLSHRKHKSHLNPTAAAAAGAAAAGREEGVLRPSGPRHAS